MRSIWKPQDLTICGNRRTSQRSLTRPAIAASTHSCKGSLIPDRNGGCRVVAIKNGKVPTWAEDPKDLGDRFLWSWRVGQAGVEDRNFKLIVLERQGACIAFRETEVRYSIRKLACFG
jgi:hypothetical protein